MAYGVSVHKYQQVHLCAHRTFKWQEHSCLCDLSVCVCTRARFFSLRLSEKAKRKNYQSIDQLIAHMLVCGRSRGNPYFIIMSGWVGARSPTIASQRTARACVCSCVRRSQASLPLRAHNNIVQCVSERIRCILFVIAVAAAAAVVVAVIVVVVAFTFSD